MTNDLSPIVGVFSDVHGATKTLDRALDRCRDEGVETIVLLGDLFDRAEQSDGCARSLSGWKVVGVYGNHEREVALAAAAGEIDLEEETVRLLSALQEEIVVDNVRLTHEIEHWGQHSHDLLARLLGRVHVPGHHQSEQNAQDAWLTFTGHTHFRQARDERGALDIARGSLTLDRTRRYLINPGALMIGQYAIWDRGADIIHFRNVEW